MQLRRLFAVSMLAITLVACGGGGGSGKPNTSIGGQPQPPLPPPNNPPPMRPILDDHDGGISIWETLGVVTIVAREYDTRVSNIVLEGLSVTGTLAGGNTDATTKFFDSLHRSGDWDEASPCVRIQRASNVVIRGMEISRCGNGLFTLSKPDTPKDVIRQVLVEGNYFHDNSLVDSDQSHQAYLQGIDFTVQYNYFGETRHRANQALGGNHLKTRIAGLVVRYNYFSNAVNAHLLDVVEIEDFASHVFPWLHAERVAGMVDDGASQQEVQDANMLQAQDWARYQNAYVYGNLIHLYGTRAPENPIHIGFDNTAFQRQPGTLWFYNNTYLAEVDRHGDDTIRLMYYGSEFGDGGYYGNYRMTTTNVGGELHYIADAGGDTCMQVQADCADYGPMLPHTKEFYGHMRAYNNAIVLLPFTAGASKSAFELTRFRWDQLDFNGGNWISDSWDTLVDATGNVQQPGFGVRDNEWAWPGGNTGYHVTGANTLIEGHDSPIVLASFEPLSGSPLLNQGVALPAEIPQALRPDMQITRDPDKQGGLKISARATINTIGAVEAASNSADPGPGGRD